MLPGYRYLDWARFGLGSKVFFDGPPGEELSFTLAELDGEKAVLDVATDHLGATMEWGKPGRLVLPAHPRGPSSLDIPAEALEWLRDHQPLTLARMRMSLPGEDPVAPDVVGERKEIIDVLGEDRLCRRIECRAGAKPVTLWLLHDVPGGVVRWEAGGAAWRLRSFEAK